MAELTARVAWARGETWEVNPTEGLIISRGTARQPGHYYPELEPNLVSDFIEVGKRDLHSTGNQIAEQEMPTKAREALQQFCDRYGAPMLVGQTEHQPAPPVRSHPGGIAIDLLVVRQTALHLAGIWEVARALVDQDPASFEALHVVDAQRQAIIFNYTPGGPTAPSMPPAWDETTRKRFLARYWITGVLNDVWELEGVSPPGPLVIPSGDGFTMANRYTSLLALVASRVAAIVGAGAVIKTCPHPYCLRDFIANRPDQKYCSEEHRKAHKQYDRRRRAKGDS